MTPDQQIARTAYRLMSLCMGWSAREMREDARDFPEAHNAQLARIRRILKRLIRDDRRAAVDAIIRKAGGA